MLFFFFFQAEDGIRDYKVTGVQTCALPIYENFYMCGARHLRSGAPLRPDGGTSACCFHARDQRGSRGAPRGSAIAQGTRADVAATGERPATDDGKDQFQSACASGKSGDANRG